MCATRTKLLAHLTPPAASLIISQVGYDLTAGLPGHSGTATVTAAGGDQVLSFSSVSGSPAAGLFIKLDGEAYEIESVDSENKKLTLVEVCSRVENFGRVVKRTRVDRASMNNG